MAELPLFNSGSDSECMSRISAPTSCMGLCTGGGGGGGIGGGSGTLIGLMTGAAICQLEDDEAGGGAEDAEDAAAGIAFGGGDLMGCGGGGGGGFGATILGRMFGRRLSFSILGPILKGYIYRVWLKGGPQDW